MMEALAPSVHQCSSVSIEAHSSSSSSSRHCNHTQQQQHQKKARQRMMEEAKMGQRIILCMWLLHWKWKHDEHCWQIRQTVGTYSRSGLCSIFIFVFMEMSYCWSWGSLIIHCSFSSKLLLAAFQQIHIYCMQIIIIRKKCNCSF